MTFIYQKPPPSFNHEEAYQLACLKQDESNLARSYIALHEENEIHKSMIITGFWGDEHPIFTQGLPVMELQEVLTAEDVNLLIAQMIECTKSLKEIKQKLENHL